MKRLFLATLAVFLPLVMGYGTVLAGNGNGNGNPFPGYPHDTIMIHVHPWAGGNPISCDGGHSLHIRANPDGTIQPVNISITMTDWHDANGNGTFDPDAGEVGGDTKAIDCDGLNDAKISIQIRDTDGRKGWVSTQNWSIRLVGKPYQAFNFTSYANHTVSCISVDAGGDGIVGTDDDTYECTSEVINLGPSDLSGLKQTGKGKKGKTSFEDITRLFLVDVDINGDNVPEINDTHIFRVSCPDNSTTIINETLDVCSLGSAIWDVDSNTGRPTIQVFVSHTGSAPIVGAKKICHPKKGC
jgi:hypothetical protein